MVNLAFRSDNQGKKGWHTLSQLRKKVPLSPEAMLIRATCHQKLWQLSQHWLMGVGKDEGMGRPLRAVKECYIPSRFSIVSTVIAVLNCIKCANYYFPWLSERNSKFAIWYQSFAYNFQTECWIVIRFRQIIHRSSVNISWNWRVWVKSFKDWSLSTMVSYT